MDIKAVVVVFLILATLTTSVYSNQLANQINGDYYYPIDQGAKCEPYIGDRPDFPLCGGLLANPNSIYVNSTTNQTYLRTQTETYFQLVQLIGPQECQSDTATYINLCSFFFLECLNVTVNDTVTNTSTVVVLPRRTCQNNCYQAATEKCQIPETLFNCSKGDPAFGNDYIPSYPVNGSLYNLTEFGGTFDYKVQCLNPLLYVNGSYNQKSCPLPLLLFNSTMSHEQGGKEGYFYVTNSSACVLPCPLPIFTENQWDSLFTFHDVIAYLSFFGSLFTFVTFACLNQFKTANDKNLALFLTSIFLMSLSGVLNNFMGRGSTESFLCPSQIRSTSSEDGMCVFNAFLFQFSALNSAAWWCVIAIEIYYTITHLTKKLELFKYYLAGITIFTLVFSFVPLGLKVYGYNKGNFMCWIVGGDVYENVFLWVPLGVALTIASVLIVLVMIEIFKVVRATGRGGSLIILEAKPMLMVIAIYFSYVYLFFWNYYSDNVVTKRIYDTEVPSFSQCLFSGRSDCTLRGPDFGMMAAYVYFLRIYGLYSFFIYGFSAKSRKIWKRSIFIHNRLVQGILARFQNRFRGSGGDKTKTNPTESTNHPSAGSNASRTISKIDVESTMKSLDYNSDSEEDLDDNEIKLQQRDVSTPF
ncbi:G-protein-coupled receptor family protein [Cavenderia fasciculata]|uniref:G-protein-coupled receptor family protein n=1 Tax=Cavenderia fasciculata TaxID=261658 RepID=F4Q1M7_CACFS|nr:G-protein-coupled receptor family protein [Cavenderia fasciculata]EGG18728.1 G-protein-coupled receptor family protein [Cavenderia fasciculata]|eukprot:XP_004366632.1 G-protein-coupled receptor family protein [Cavenderia fasciculata]